MFKWFKEFWHCLKRKGVFFVEEKIKVEDKKEKEKIVDKNEKYIS